MVPSLCPCFSNIDSVEPFTLNTITFQLKYDVSGVCSAFEGKEGLFFASYCSPVTSLSFPAWFLYHVSQKLFIVFRIQQDERPCFHMEETRF